MSRLLDYDPITKERTVFDYDDASDTFVISTEQDVTDLIERNKAIHRATDERAGWKGDMHLVASIPMPLLFDLRRKGIIQDGEFHSASFRRWLNDRDNLLFRTRPGNI